MELKLAKRRNDWWVRALCTWARDNEPLLTFRSDEEIEKIVRAARTEKAGLVAAISIPFALLTTYLGWRITTDLFGHSPEWWHTVVGAMLAGAAGARIGRFLCELVMHREISRLARGTYGQLEHG